MVIARHPYAARLLAVVLLTATAAGCTPAASGGPTRPTARTALHGLLPDEPAARPRFTLTDTRGTAYDFAARTRSRVTLLFWGYTACDDICPTTMADIAAALRRLPDQVRRQVIVVFASTDPRRDTPPVVRRWLDRFDASFVGLTGTAAQLAAAQRAAGVPVAVQEKMAGGNYAVDHFAGVTAYARDDRAAAVYPAGATASDYAADLPVLVQEGS